MRKKKKYNPENCHHRIVAQFEDNHGNKIALLAHRAFKWCIYKDIDGKIIIVQASREEAKREYKRLAAIHKPI